MSERSTFYYDLASPYAYLSAERITAAFEDAGAEQPEWQPILLGGLFKRFDRGSWGLTAARDTGMREIERRAQAYGLPPMRWPDPWPGNYVDRDARRDLREGDRAHDLVLARRLQAGLRRRT